MISCLKTPLLFCVVLAVVAAQDYTFNFEGCDVDSYYSDLNDDVTSWTRDEVHSLIQGTHRHQLPYTTVGQAGNDDVWAALMDVDEGSVTETVSLIYSSDRVDAIPFGQYTWIKEHVWPVLSLIESEVSLSDTDMIGKDISDIHNIFPASVLSAQVRGTKYFGECGVLSENPNRCRSPAEGGAQDTCACQEVYTPPADKKGDIARALLYMDLRYDGSDRFTQDLRLTDCPFVPLRDMGYLSQMIAWHLEDPPSTEEIQRNDRICQHWQGNRNPLVDHPEIAAALYHEPLDLPVIGERTTYEACDEIPTEPPTRTPDLCDTQVFAGDIYFFMLNSVDPDSIGMYNFRTLPAGLEILMTDNAWNGTAFVNDVPEKDGTVKVSASYHVRFRHDRLLTHFRPWSCHSLPFRKTASPLHRPLDTERMVWSIPTTGSPSKETFH
jgi:endonuclease I